MITHLTPDQPADAVELYVAVRVVTMPANRVGDEAKVVREIDWGSIYPTPQDVEQYVAEWWTAEDGWEVCRLTGRLEFPAAAVQPGQQRTLFDKEGE